MVSHGSRSDLVPESGMPGRGETRGADPAERAWGIVTGQTYRSPTAQARTTQLPPRRLSCVVRGRLALLAMVFQPEPFPVGILRAEAWPTTMSAPQKQSLGALSKKKTQKEKERRKRQKRRARARVQK